MATSVTVSFNTNGGSTIAIKTYVSGIKYGAAPNESLPTSIRSGYIFEGWYSHNSFNLRITDNSLVPDTNHSLYAKWIKVGGFTEDAAETKFVIYPNPAKELLFIETNESIWKIEIYSVTGRLMKAFDKNARELDIQFLPTGTYILYITTDKTRISKVLIKE